MWAAEVSMALLASLPSDISWKEKRERGDTGGSPKPLALLKHDSLIDILRNE